MHKIFGFLFLLLAPLGVHAQAPVTQGPTKVKGDLSSTTKVTAPQFCLGNSCITVWPTGGGTVNITYPGAGIVVSDGSNWLTSLGSTGTGNVVRATNATLNGTTIHTAIIDLYQEPVNSTDAATKHYVDTTVTNTLAGIGSLPGSETRFLSAATCNGGVAFSSAFSTYDNQQPQLGCVNPSASSVAYLNFQATPLAPQYATASFTPPPYWTGSDITLYFTTPATTGNVSWILEFACTNPTGDLSTLTYSTPTTITTSAGTGLRVSTQQTNLFVPGANGCAAGNNTAPGSILTFRVHRSATDTAAADAQFLGATLTSRRSQ